MKTSRPTKRSPARSPRSTIEAPLRAIARVAKTLGAKWYLFGAQAVALHGVPRATQDIDVTLLGSPPAALLFKELRRAGITPLITDRRFLATTRVIPALHKASGWKVDVVLGGPGLEEHFEREAIKRRVGRVTVPLIRAEHLVALKILAGRPQDLVDVGSIVRIKGRALDLDEVRELLGALEEGLAESDLLERFEAIAGTSRPRRRRRR